MTQNEENSPQLDHIIRKLKQRIKVAKLNISKGLDPITLAGQLIDDANEMVIHNLRSNNPNITPQEIKNYFRKLNEIKIKLRNIKRETKDNVYTEKIPQLKENGDYHG